jgi:hypothetical protein
VNLKDQIKKAQENIGRHPVGIFDPSHIESIKEVTMPNGALKWEIMVRSTIDKEVKVDWFVPDYTMASCDNRPDAMKWYIEGMARLCKAYVGLGLAEPEGDDHTAMETNARERIGEWIGRPCKLIVQEDKKDARYVRGFIQASFAAAQGEPPAPLRGSPGGFDAPDPSTVPF